MSSKIFRIRKLLLASTLLGASLAGAGSAWAQDPVPSDDTEKGAQVEDIVVTARKTAENLQRVPIAIAALSSDALESKNVTRLEQIGDFVPNLNVEQSIGTASAAQFTLRGIAVYDYEPYIEPPIALYVDGVLYPQARMYNIDNLADVERIEVLYGPQGTLFGRNTTGGAVSITTRAPSDTFGFQQKIGYGTDNEIILKSILDTGEIGKSGLKAKIAYMHYQMDGYQNDLNAPSRLDPGSRNSESLSGTLHGDLSPTLSFDLRGDWTQQRFTPAVYQIVTATPNVISYFNQSPSFGGQPFIVSGDRLLKTVYSNNFLPRAESVNWGTSLTVTLAASDAFNLKNILAYRDMNADEHPNVSGQGNLRGPVLDPVTFAPAGTATVSPFNSFYYLANSHNITNELQATGTIGQLKYAAGLFYFDQKASGATRTLFTFVLSPTTAFNSGSAKEYYLDSTSYAAYGQASYRPSFLDERLELTGGVRYTVDKKSEYELKYVPAIPRDDPNSALILAGTQRLSNKWDNFSYNASANFQWTPAIMTFARVATSYKTGGFNPGALAPAYDPEKAMVIEAGVKADLFDRRVRFNATAFRTRYTDKQINRYVVDPIRGISATVITNDATVVYKGFEAALTVVPVPGLQFEGNLGHVDPNYTRYPFSFATPGVPGGVTTIDVSDEAHAPQASKWTYNIGGVYSVDLANIGELSFRVNYAYKSPRYYFSLDREYSRNFAVRGNATHTLNANISVADVRLTGDTTAKFELWGTNLLNEDQKVGGVDFGALGFGTNVYLRDRAFGASVTAKF